MGLGRGADAELLLEELGEAAPEQEVGRALRVGSDGDAFQLRIGRRRKAGRQQRGAQRRRDVS